MKTLWKFLGRLRKKQLYQALDEQIATAERIGHNMDHYRLTVDGETGWFLRVCHERIEDEDAKRKDNNHGACSGSTPCIINP